ncbi:MAG: tRNA pseudouridine(55) synthase TruB [Candidatus Omnitrophica bacterium]|nr:tRNA pseudouridine(55) synthase TruB [Candidatus Omnitrophota bacterium]
MENTTGIFLIDKPQGWTSNDVCQFIKRKFKFKKVGHGGTLDPFATGVLVLFVDDATQLSHLSLNDKKVYEGVIHLGLATSTGDPEGEVLGRMEIPDDWNRDWLQSVLNIFLGHSQQKPPMMSAIKKNGIPLYRLARKGIEVDREPRNIEISELTVLDWQRPFLHFRAQVSKGTYIRVLAEDIGLKLSTKASLSVLRRIASGDYHIERSISIDQIKQMNTKEELLIHASLNAVSRL